MRTAVLVNRSCAELDIITGDGAPALFVDDLHMTVTLATTCRAVIIHIITLNIPFTRRDG